MDRIPSERVSFERLRERTDELELLISGLSMVALFSLPGWLLHAYEESYALLSLAMLSAATVAVPMVVLVCYLLASCFALHLGIRAYWVALIGLKAAFPAGIRFARMVGSGPLTRERLEARLPPLEVGIERADRAASVLFSIVLLAGLTLLWLGALATLVFVTSGVLGQRMGGANVWINRAMDGFLTLLVGSVMLLWLADAVLARWLPALRGFQPWRLLVRVLGAIVDLYFPAPLLGHVKLTLQTNTRPWLFLLCFAGGLLLLPLTAIRHFQPNQGFDRFGTYGLLHSRDVAAGQRSVHFESQRTGRFRSRAVPMLPAPVIETGWVPLFLPYMPVRDDSVLAARCPGRTAEAAASAATGIPDELASARSREAARCLARLWSVRLNGQPVSLDDFFPAERADLNFRGLSGYIDLRQQSPGLQQLEIVYRPEPQQDGPGVDETISVRQRFVIPFLWSPEAAVEFRD